MKVLPIIFRELIPTGSRAVRSWTQGELLQAMVEDVTPVRAVLRLESGGTVSARYQGRLAPGDRLLLKTRTTGPRVDLRVVEHVSRQTPLSKILSVAGRTPEPISHARLLQSLDALARVLAGGDRGETTGRVPGRNLNRTMARLVRLFPGLPPDGPEELERLVKDSGLFLEGKIARGEKGFEEDLKALLLRLRGELRDFSARPAGAGSGGSREVPGGPPESIARAEGDPADIRTAVRTALETVEDAVRGIEARQATALAQGAGRSETPLQIPLPLSAGFRQAELSVDPETHTGSGTDPPPARIRLALEMTLLGRIVIDLVADSAGGVLVRFSPDRGDTARALDGNIRELNQALCAQGLRVGRIFVGTAPVSEEPGSGTVGLDLRV